MSSNFVPASGRRLSGQGAKQGGVLSILGTLVSWFLMLGLPSREARNRARRYRRRALLLRLSREEERVSRGLVEVAGDLHRLGQHELGYDMDGEAFAHWRRSYRATQEAGSL